MRRVKAAILKKYSAGRVDTAVSRSGPASSASDVAAMVKRWMVGLEHARTVFDGESAKCEAECDKMLSELTQVERQLDTVQVLPPGGHAGAYPSKQLIAYRKVLHETG